MFIKITYVAELQVADGLIEFCLPGSVAPWDKDSALHQNTQVTCRNTHKFCNEIQYYAENVRHIIINLLYVKHCFTLSQSRNTVEM